MTGHSGRRKTFLCVKAVALSVAGYVALSYAVGLVVWRGRREDRTGMSSLYFLFSPLTVPVLLYLTAMGRL